MVVLLVRMLVSLRNLIEQLMSKALTITRSPTYLLSQLEELSRPNMALLLPFCTSMPTLGKERLYILLANWNGIRMMLMTSPSRFWAGVSSAF